MTKSNKNRIRNRNRETRRVRAGDLLPHAGNRRTHSDRKTAVLRDLLEEVGFVGTLIGRDTPDGLQLIDGHLRAETMPDEEVDVMVVDLEDNEVEAYLSALPKTRDRS